MHAVLLIRCADRPGIVAAVSTFLFRHGANVVDLDQHSTEEEPRSYFMRLELQTQGLDGSVAYNMGAWFVFLSCPSEVGRRVLLARPRLGQG